jgi:23S rRNA (cytidine1920-2'-O)/16S rRNA (cytidine1409-2'-O)-methyltransferase
MTRADIFLVEHGHAASRAEAQAAIKAGLVRVNGAVLDKPSRTIADGAAVEYQKPHPYVSRGGVKLAAALDAFNLSPEGLTCIDLGASTGGFTQVLLERGARKVFAVDVGHDQLHADIAADPRVVSLEHQNARDLSSNQIVGAVQAIVCDVSFISLKLVLPPVLKMARPDAWLVALVKPQFEVGPEHVGKGGIVRDSYFRTHAVVEFLHWLNGQGDWRYLLPPLSATPRPPLLESPIPGGDGNKEFLVAARNDGVLRSNFDGLIEPGS